MTLRRGPGIEDQHVQREAAVAELIDDHLPLVGGVAGPRAEPRAEHVARQHRNRPDQLCQRAQGGGVIVSVNEEVPVLAVFLGPGLDPVRGFVEQGGAAVVEKIVAVAAKRAGIGDRRAARLSMLDGTPPRFLSSLSPGRQECSPDLSLQRIRRLSFENGPEPNL